MTTEPERLDPAATIIYEFEQWRDKFADAMHHGDSQRVRRYHDQGRRLAARMWAVAATDDTTLALVDAYRTLRNLLDST